MKPISRQPCPCRGAPSEGVVLCSDGGGRALVYGLGRKRNAAKSISRSTTVHYAEWELHRGRLPHRCVAAANSRAPSGDPAGSLWESVPDKPFLQVARGNAIIREHGNPLGSFNIKDTLSHVSTFDNYPVGCDARRAHPVCAGLFVFFLDFRLPIRVSPALSENQLQFAISTEGHGAEPFNRIFL